MGYNTTLLLLNDALYEIENDKEFGKNVAAAVKHLSVSEGRSINIGSGNHGNAALAVESHHADMTKLIAVGGNNAKDMGYHGFCGSTNVELLKSLAKSMGYQVRKKSKVKSEK